MTYRSRFGGFWTDRLDALECLEARRRDGAIDAPAAERLRTWIADGYVVLPGAVAPERIDAFNADVARIFESGNAKIFADFVDAVGRFTIPVEPHHRDMNVKLLDLYGHLESARRIVFSAPILDFLRLVFEREPLAFQSLYMVLGSKQEIHQDTTYVGVDPPLEFAGTWVALEDVAEHSGELEYYVGSHRFDGFVWDDGKRLMPAGHPDHARYLESLHEQARRRGARRERFRPRKGDALIWAADFAHGGSQRIDPGRTRRSLVTHFCPLDRAPIYFRDGSHSPKIRHASGGHYCYAVRWAHDADDERAWRAADAVAGAAAAEPPARRRRRWRRFLPARLFGRSGNG